MGLATHQGESRLQKLQEILHSIHTLPCQVIVILKMPLLLLFSHVDDNIFSELFKRENCLNSWNKRAFWKLNLTVPIIYANDTIFRIIPTVAL